MNTPARALPGNRSGAVAAEYALITALIVMLILGGAGTVGKRVGERLGASADHLGPRTADSVSVESRSEDDSGPEETYPGDDEEGGAPEPDHRQ